LVIKRFELESEGSWSDWSSHLGLELLTSFVLFNRHRICFHGLIVVVYIEDCGGLDEGGIYVIRNSIREVLLIIGITLFDNDDCVWIITTDATLLLKT